MPPRLQLIGLRMPRWQKGMSRMRLVGLTGVVACLAMAGCAPYPNGYYAARPPYTATPGPFIAGPSALRPDGGDYAQPEPVEVQQSYAQPVYPQPSYPVPAPGYYGYTPSPDLAGSEGRLPGIDREQFERDRYNPNRLNQERLNQQRSNQEYVSQERFDQERVERDCLNGEQQDRDLIRERALSSYFHIRHDATHAGSTDPHLLRHVNRRRQGDSRMVLGGPSVLAASSSGGLDDPGGGIPEATLEAYGAWLILSRRRFRMPLAS